MIFSLASIFKTILLLINALAILHERRFLKLRIINLNIFIYIDGLDNIDPSQSPKSLKNQFISLLQAIRWLRSIIINIFIL